MERSEVLQRPLPREFASREDLIEYCRREFPEAAGLSPEISATRGGAAAARAQRERIEPVRYGFNRNYIAGNVSRLSMYLRHGVLTLAEVKRAAIARDGAARQAAKFITELAWRDYWQRVYAMLGDGIWADRESYKTGFLARAYADELPADVEAGSTGLRCMDSFARELRETGYLHNHARMWVAAYVVHWRRAKWQAGARWFLRHLLDGDPASNNLSWQWVASTFSHKPYFFNRENVEKYTDGVFCGLCAARTRCPFEGRYEDLGQRLFRIEGEWG